MLLAIDHQLFGRKSPDAVAYYAALWGIDVPVNLVADHLVKSIETFYSLLRRRLIRQHSNILNLHELDEPDVRRLAKTASKDVLRIVSIKNPIKRALMKQFAEALCFVTVKIIYDVKPLPSFPEAMRKVANGIFQAPVAALSARFLHKALRSEGPRFVDPTMGRNKILDEIRTTERNRPQLILQACRDSGSAFAAATRAFGLEQLQRNGRPPNDLKGPARDNVRTIYAFLPLVSAYFLAFNLDSPKSRFLSMLRTSGGIELERQIKRLDNFSEWQRRRLEKGL